MIGYAYVAPSVWIVRHLAFIVHILRFSEFSKAFAHYGISCVYSAS